jgi:hypothetical protein
MTSTRIRVDLSDATRSWEHFKVTVPENSSGDWKISKFTVGPLDPQRLSHAAKGRDCGIGTFTKLSRWDEADYAHEVEHLGPRGSYIWVPVMSDTRTEIIEHWPVIQRLFEPDCTQVLIGALGLGMVTRAALLSPYVQRVDVVDLSPDVIAMVAPHLDDPRLHVHEGDIFDWVPPQGLAQRYDVAWYDPWDTIDANNLPAMRTLRERYNAGWAGCWSEPEALYNARREMAFEDGTLSIQQLAELVFEIQCDADTESLMAHAPIRDMWDSWCKRLDDGTHAAAMKEMQAEKVKTGTVSARTLLERSGYL